jgi:hypothetical protein
MSLWKKSSRSNGNGGNNCVEVRVLGLIDVVLVRNSKRPDYDLQFTTDEWKAFIEGVKAGEFDQETFGERVERD